MAGKAAACPVLRGNGLVSAGAPVTATDLLELAEIGYPDASLTGPTPFGLSSDRTRIAFILTGADVGANSYCRALVILPLSGAKPRVIDVGGEFQPLGNFVRGLWVETGFPALVTPAWSPDGRSIALLHRTGGTTQVSVVAADGSGSTVTTQLASDAISTGWTERGKLLLATRPNWKSEEARIDAEGQTGWLYDARIAPNYGARPRIRESEVPLELLEVDPASGRTQPTKLTVPSADPADRLKAASAGQAWLERVDTNPFAPRRLSGLGDRGAKSTCSAAACSGRFLGLWWDGQSREVIFLRRQGWNLEQSALYRWRPATGKLRLVFATSDVVQNCAQADAKLVCTVESSNAPPRVVLIDSKTGHRRMLFDPNPQFNQLRPGKVERLRVRNDRGLEAWADLVLPPDWRPGTKLPLVIVQYNSRGFLRGGTGNEYPIFPLASRGFAVLSLERPPAIASKISGLRTDVELNGANDKRWAERKSMLSATLRALNAAIATGSVDPDRVGITGLSDGATSARFALINSDRFAAAAISSCCLEPKTVMTYGGIAWAEYNRAVGYPPVASDSPRFWAEMSIARNAKRITTPLLMQASDDEYLLALEAFEALREAQAPAELYVFPDEHHVKWQPQHKLALFERTADWFSFWLQCRKDGAPQKADLYRRWERMAADQPARARICPLNAIAGPSIPHPQAASAAGNRDRAPEPDR